MRIARTEFPVAGRLATVVVLFAVMAVLLGCIPSADGAASTTSTAVTQPRLSAYEVVASYPHDPTAFLQGLVWHDGGFYESTGLYGQSSLRRVAFPSGDVMQYQPLDSQYFGEGLARVDDRLLQLTWRAGVGFVYDRDSFAQLDTFSYSGEGWGITYDGESLILSDGSDELRFLDPRTFQTIRTLSVTAAGEPVTRLNELEWIEGEVWANVWMTEQIVRIDPTSGQVSSVLDLEGLRPTDLRANLDAVLNGIAYDPEQRRIFVGGKLWPQLFEIRLLDGLQERTEP